MEQKFKNASMQQNIYANNAIRQKNRGVSYVDEYIDEKKSTKCIDESASRSILNFPPRINALLKPFCNGEHHGRMTHD